MDKIISEKRYKSLLEAEQYLACLVHSNLDNLELYKKLMYNFRPDYLEVYEAKNG